MVLEPDTERCTSEDARSPRGVDYEIPHRLERGTKHSFIRVWKPLPRRQRYKIVRLTTIRNGLKRTISASARLGLRLLQMVLEPNTKRCASKDAGSPWGMDYEISHRLKRRTKHSL